MFREIMATLFVSQALMTRSVMSVRLSNVATSDAASIASGSEGRWHSSSNP